MNEDFKIPVVYNGTQYHFKARMLQFGYTHKFQVDVNGTEVLFEPDEEGNYRAYIDSTNKAALSKADIYLLKEIALAIESLIK